ncbi:MAG: acetyl-CoA carboxylase biotin carboxyl carrier protein subunit [Ignavibacterium sp.]|nr:MAG: acetyl-CoA carboxylase biotin carboxyl carrier protein subunit [Ignavibacterium sp.]
MKKFKFTIQGNIYEVEILNIEDNIAEIEVNGSPYQVEIHKELKTPKTPKLVRKAVEPSPESDTTKTHKPSDKAAAAGIKAPLPGTILEIKKNVGDEVKVGDTILIMEAMKMENNINADKNGKIKSLKVSVGDSVLEGDVLVEVAK